MYTRLRETATARSASRSLCPRSQKADEVGVLELGMSEPGELTVIAQIAKPDIAVITNIGITHIEQLGSRENIYKER